MEQKNRVLEELLQQDSNDIIDTDYLKIYGNVLEWGNTLIQISNIARISNIPLTDTPFPRWTVVFLLLGMGSLDFSLVLGLILLAIPTISIVLWNMENKKRRKHTSLNIYLNSGRILSILFADKSFLEEVLIVMKKLIADPSVKSSEIIINIKDNVLSGDSSIIR